MYAELILNCPILPSKNDIKTNTIVKKANVNGLILAGNHPAFASASHLLVTCSCAWLSALAIISRKLFFNHPLIICL